jgi:4'-phosphopantetheinyl transferase
VPPAIRAALSRSVRAMAEARVFRVELDRDEKEVAALGGVLTADELLRAGRIKSQNGRARAVVIRAALRKLLARELGRKPDEVAFAVGPHGKPRLDDPAGGLLFNLSHSAGLALVAIARDVEVGVDLEEIRPRTDLQRVARRVFTQAEREAVEIGGEKAFYRHWVAKEAFVKATGRGIESLRSFEVLLDGPGGARLNHVAGDPAEAANWTLAPLDVGSSFAAAVVVAAPDARIELVP